MKYLTNEVANSSRAEWDRACMRLCRAFRRIEKYFSSEFSKCFLEGDFHDSSIIEILFCCAQSNTADLHLKMQDGYENEICHYLTLKNVTNVKLNTDLCSDWLYAEILPVTNEKYVEGKRFSLEVTFPNDKSLYLHFGRIEYYRKKNNSPSP